MANILLGIHCVVPQCTSTLRKVNQWKARPCPKPKHKGKTQSQCMCPEPYQFFKFPSEIKLQKLWLERVRRPDLEINNLTRVCSLHFVEGKPTRRNYFPNINLHSRTHGEDNDNDDVEEEQKRHSEDPHPTPTKIPRRGEGVSVVPMELLQEGDDEEVYEGDLTISRFSFYRRNEENNVNISRVYETVPTPTNTVTITRVTTSTKSSAENGSTTSRVDNHATGIPVETRKVVSSPRVLQRTTHHHGSVHNANPGSSKIKRFVEVRDETEEYDYPYEIDMVEDDGDGSELSDLGNEVQPARQAELRLAPVGERYSVDTPRTIVHSQSDFRPTLKQATPVSVPSNATAQTVLVKPKLIPVLAVAPKTQHQVIQPLTMISRVDQGGQAPRKATPIQPKQQVSQNTSTTKGNPGTSTNSATTTSISLAGGGTSNIQTQDATQSPLATYDPSKQQLQIANPVKYIQECHTRIADLVAENDKLKAKNSELETEVQELQKSNSELRREVAQQQSKRTQQVPVSTINIVPNQEQSVTDNITVASTNSSKTRIRYVIRRPMQ